MFLDNYNKILMARAARKYGSASVINWNNEAVNFAVNDGYSSAFWPLFRDNNTNIAPLCGSLMYVSNDTTIFYENSSMSYDPSRWGVIFGDGDTPASYNDYKLSGNIITDFTASSQANAFIADGAVYNEATYNITNTGAANIVIKEIGISLYDNYHVYRILITHDVFEAPIVIAPGSTGIVKYIIKIS